MNAHDIKTVRDAFGKAVKTCTIDGMCSTHCPQRFFSGRLDNVSVHGCLAFTGNFVGAVPHPNCLGPGVDTGPVEHDKVKVGEKYYTADMRCCGSNYLVEVEIIELDFGPKDGKIVIEYLGEFCMQMFLDEDRKIYQRKRSAAKEVLRLLEEIQKKLKKI